MGLDQVGGGGGIVKGRGRERSGFLRNDCERESKGVRVVGKGRGRKTKGWVQGWGGGEGGHVIRVGGDPSSHLSPGS